MNSVGYSETFAPVYQATLRHIPKDSTLSSQAKLDLASVSEVFHMNLGLHPLPILKSWELNFATLEASVMMGYIWFAD